MILNASNGSVNAFNGSVNAFNVLSTPPELRLPYKPNTTSSKLPDDNLYLRIGVDYIADPTVVYVDLGDSCQLVAFNHMIPSTPGPRETQRPIDPEIKDLA